jgi:DNA (cytosine-5)-methyltransferase 1
LTLKLFELFSGIGGFSYAAKHFTPKGSFETVGFCEKNEWCRELTQKHHPSIPIHEDIVDLTIPAGEVDVITMGFPCQDLSSAGAMLGFSGERSRLFYEAIRVICHARPRYVVLENVSSLRALVLPTVLREFSCSGYDAEWANIRASDLGACHQRSRFYLLAYPNSDRNKGKESQAIRSKVWEKEGIRRISRDYREYNAQPLLCRANDGVSERLYTAIELLKSSESEESLQSAERKLTVALRFLWYAKDPATASLQGWDYHNMRRVPRKFAQYAGTAHQERLRICERLRNLWEFLSGEELQNDKNLLKRLLIRARQVQYCKKVGTLHRYDRLQALGNAVVPQCAAVPLRRILEMGKTYAKYNFA